MEDLHNPEGSDLPEDCRDEVDAYLECQAAAPVSSYECVENAPSWRTGAGDNGCVEVENAFISNFNPTTRDCVPGDAG
jgi:hypothetical protein